MKSSGVISMLLGLAVSACNTFPVQSVHALRAYERERVTPELVSQHLDELSSNLALINRILRETKYQPGDAWTSALAMTDATAGQARSRLLSQHPGPEMPTTLAVYAQHVRDVLAHADARTVTEAAGAPPTYPSILDALSQADPSLRQLREDYEGEERLAKQVREAKAEEERARNSGSYNGAMHAFKQTRAAKERLEAFQNALKERAARLSQQNPATAQIVNDALATTSVALRLAGEAAALASMLLLEIPRLASLPAREYARNPELAAKLISQGPAQVKQIASDLELAVQSLTHLAEALARLNTSDIQQAPGFLYREGLVDEVVGFTTDLLHFQADAGGEAYYFKSFGMEGGRDYTGRTNTLRYHVEPIVLASARLSAGFDLSRLPEAGGLKLGYATNRVYQSGGTIENRSLASELGATGRFSDALDAALLYSGWASSVRIAHFTSGTVDVVDAATGTVTTNAPFTFSLKEIAITKELVPYGAPNVKSFVIKFGYFDYTLPRIMYQFQNTTPDADKPTWVYSRETDPQRVRTQLLTQGGTSMLEFPLFLRDLRVLFGLNLSWGIGRQKFYYLDDEGNRKDRAPFTVAFSALSHLGLGWRLVGLGSRFHLDAEAVYQAQYLNSSLGTTFGLDGAVPIGSHALFHGPHGRLSASF